MTNHHSDIGVSCKYNQRNFSLDVSIIAVEIRFLFKILISEHKPEKEAPNQVYDKTNLAPLFRLLKDSLC